MDNNEKIQLDDITLDDIISGEGVETISSEEPVAPENKVDELPEESVETIDEVTSEEDENTEVEETEDKLEDSEESEAKQDENTTVVSEVLEKLGYNLDGKKYEDTSEGLANMTADVANKMADSRMEEALNAFPLVRKHLEYVLAGGQSQNFMQAYDPNLDYNKIEVQEDDLRSQKALLGDYFATKGHDKEFIEEIIGDYEDTGKLYTKAKAAKTALAKVQEENRARMVTKQQSDLKVQRQKLTEFWDGVSNTIKTSKEFNGITVPDREKEQFFTYLSTPVNKDGLTKRDVDHQKAPMETKLAIDYLMFIGFNLDKLISSKARTKSVRSLKDRIGRNEEYVKSARRSTRKSKSVDLDDLDLTI